MELKGKLEIKNNAIYLFDGNHSIPLFTWMVSHNMRVGDIVRIQVAKENENEV